MAQMNAITYCKEQHTETECYITTIDIGMVTIHTIGSIHKQLTNHGLASATEDSRKDNALAILNTMAGNRQWQLCGWSSYDDMEMWS